MADMSVASDAKDPHKIFVVCGRNEKARKALFAFLHSLHLHPQEWEQWVQETREGSPYTGDVLKQGFEEAGAFVVLLTPDVEARLQEHLHGKAEEPYEINLTGQPRPNVIFEAGMAMGINARKTVIVQIGKLRPMSDIFGRLIVRLDNTASKRNALSRRLACIGCPVDTGGDDWLTAGDFDAVAKEIEEAAAQTEETEGLVAALSDAHFYWNLIEERDRELLTAIYEYTLLNGVGIKTDEFIQSAHGQRFSLTTVRQDLGFLIHAGHLNNPDGRTSPVVIFSLSPSAFEICAQHFEADFADIKKRAIQRVVEIAEAKNIDDLARQIAAVIERPLSWTHLLALLLYEERYLAYVMDDDLFRATPIAQREAGVT